MCTIFFNMTELTVTDLHRSFGDLQVLKGLSFSLNRGERVGVVGANGCGKTTLFRILAGRLEADQGVVQPRYGLRMGMVEQLPDYPPETLVRDVLWEAFSDIEKQGRKLSLLEQQMAEGQPVDMRAYADLQAAYEWAGGYDLKVPYGRMTAGLHISPEMQDRPFSSLSGGEKTRITLARVMLSGADLLLLDEPTNHLDLDSIEWLEEYLRAFPGAALVISHDRYFLDRVATRVLELSDGVFTSYPGNYSEYVDKKEELAQQLEREKARQDKEIARLSFTVQRMRGWGLGNHKLMKRAIAMERRLNRIERIQTIRKERKMTSGFADSPLSGDEVLVIDRLHAGYETPLLSDFSALVSRGERIAVLGPNGCGKTTLVRTILGELPRLGGELYWGVGVKPGYLPQVVEFKNPSRNLLDTMLYETKSSVQQARDRLAAYQFQGEDVFKPVHLLSGGEKTRLKLCIFMNTQVNTLFLDEPTNHLDILSREWMEEAIDDFSETMLFISHDRYFINRLATRIWMVEDGKITDFTGTFDAFQEARKRPAFQPPAPKTEPRPKEPKRNAKTEEKQKRELARAISAMELKLQQLGLEIENAANDYERLAPLFTEKEELEEQLLILYEKWEDA